LIQDEFLKPHLLTYNLKRLILLPYVSTSFSAPQQRETNRFNIYALFFIQYLFLLIDPKTLYYIG